MDTTLVEKRPVIFDEEEYGMKRQDYNPGVDSIPHDFMRFGPAALENPLMELLHADDQWTFAHEKEGEEWNIPHVKTEIENGADKVVYDNQLSGDQAAFVRERMLADSGGLNDRFLRATIELQEDCPIYAHQLKLLNGIVARTGGKKPTIRPKRGDGIITWGNRIPLGDCESQEATIGKLNFRATDFGDTIRFSERSRKFLGNIEPQEKDQCVLLRVVAGAQRIREARKNDIPILARVLAEVEEWRKEEYRQAREALIAVEHAEGEFAAEIRRAAHDVIQSGHGRDYRGFALFCKELFQKNGISVRVFDLRNRDGGGYIMTVNLFTCADADDENPATDLLAYRHHMRWLKLCEDALMSDRRTWKEDFLEHVREYAVNGRQEKVDGGHNEQNDRIVTLNPCRFCRKMHQDAKCS